MPVPTKVEQDKVKKKIEKFLKNLNPDGSPKRPIDDNLAKGLMRSAVRDKWLYCHTKLAFLLMHREPNDGLLEGKAKWVHKCNICKGYFKESDVNTDHRLGEKSFTEWEQAQEYASSILDVCFDDLQVLCIPCHKTKTRCEQLGLDWATEEGWEQGLLEQEFTRIIDSKAKGQRDFLEAKNIIPAKNEELRKQQIREVLFNES